MTDTTIQWTDKTWNPVTGCTKVSAGCKNCYAEKVADRFWKDRKFTDVRCHPERLDQPLKWRKPARIFVNSMSDLFHEDVPREFIYSVFATMAFTPWHTFQILTKRPERMRDFIVDAMKNGAAILPNVWLGVSAENQETLKRAWVLCETPAAWRFISLEPLLGPVDLDALELLHKGWRKELTIGRYLDWIIVGGESGPKARPFDLKWPRDVIRQAKQSSTTVFVKQLGAAPEMAQGCGDCDPCTYGQPCMLAYNVGMRLKDRKGGDMSEWPEDLRVRQYPQEVLAFT